MSEARVCEHCGATEPEVGHRLQPVLLVTGLMILDGTWCRPCARALGDGNNWVIRGKTATFDPLPEKEETDG